MRSWQLQAAKARLSEVVRAAEAGGPQEITLRGKSVAVVVGKSDYDRLTSKGGSFVGFMRRSPLVGMRLEAERQRKAARRVRS